jgi:hypothetical protein
VWHLLCLSGAWVPAVPVCHVDNCNLSINLPSTEHSKDCELHLLEACKSRVGPLSQVTDLRQLTVSCWDMVSIRGKRSSGTLLYWSVIAAGFCNSLNRVHNCKTTAELFWSSRCSSLLRAMQPTNHVTTASRDGTACDAMTVGATTACSRTSASGCL